MVLLLEIMLLISIAFLTLFERKILSLSQLRLGPNKVSIYGIIQPIIDGIKLMKKTYFVNLNSHEMMYKIISFSIIFLSLLFWISIPYSSWSNKVLVMLFILTLFGLMSYMVLMLGWSSMSNYGLIGGNRSLAQVLSFEMVISLLVVIIFVVKMKMSIKFYNYSSYFYFFMFSSIFIISIFLETHRAPMDLSEGESELVGGYNTEFGSIFFVMIFLSEYSSILFMMILYFMLWYKLNLFFMFLMLIIMIIRSCFPRIRYDYIMMLVWLKIMPFLIMLWFIMVMIKN